MRKGQAAMEFLMTYGWAILAAVIVIGVLAYFGVFSPSTYVQNQCTLSAPMGCNKGAVSATTSGVTFELVNGAGEAATNVVVAITGCGNTAAAPIATLAESTPTAITVTCAPALATGKFKGAIAVNYTIQGSTIVQTSTGSVVAKV
jgi:hypothetical protein